jgi:hypothetical protein
MRLTDFAPRFTHSHGDERITHIGFRCPCKPDCAVEIVVSFTPALDGSETPAEWKPWRRESGSTFDDLTLSPSIHLHPSPHENCAGWHGFLQNGELKTC